MAEVHFVGTLHGAQGFSSSRLACRWRIATGSAWTLIEGRAESQTHVDQPTDDGFTVWSHPIDVHYGVTSLQGWPKFVVDVFEHDTFGRQQLCGYGYVDIPAVPGTHHVECATWQVVGSLYSRLQAYFLGLTPALKHGELVHTASDRFKLRTRACGRVILEVTVVVRGFEQHGVSLS
ncbi:hypothetical protein RI367_008256 [Sorochytrium milnesiophthora]